MLASWWTPGASTIGCNKLSWRPALAFGGRNMVIRTSCAMPTELSISACSRRAGGA